MPLGHDRSACRRIDLHCHSDASNKTSEAALNAIGCPESFSAPADVYAQAKARGMDFVTLTDHDSIEGAMRIADRPDVLVGEELTCWFPEDRCKMHVLVWGITPADHEALQAAASDIYQVAAYIENSRIAHAVAHPLYRQNDRLERWHLERLMLLFKGFESLNGSHSALHREAFEPTLDRLCPEYIQKLSERHLIAPRWPEPWIKARTGGTDDHGLLNIGRTWTEFPPETRTVDEVLQCLREGRCRPGGEAGSAIKLAHNFYGVAVRYYSRRILTPSGKKPNIATLLLQTLIGERGAPTKRQIAGMVLKHKARKFLRNWTPPALQRKRGSADSSKLLRDVFLQSARAHADAFPELREALERGLPPVGENARMFDFVSTVNRDVSEGIAEAISSAIDEARYNGLFESIAAILGQQFFLMPYYFAFFHQNRERKLLQRLTGDYQPRTETSLKLGLFTDTLDEVNGVCRFIRDMGEQAGRKGRSLVIHTCSEQVRFDLPNRKNFKPLLTRQLPYYPELRLSLPPLLEVLEWADRQQFDAIHVSTPGPMGLCGWMVAKMLRVPLLGTYHTDFPAYVQDLTRDHRMTRGTAAYMQWFYGQMSTVFSRSRQYKVSLMELGIAEPKLATTLPGINTEKFNPRHRDPGIWARRGIRQPRRILYCGRVSIEKNLPVLVDAFQRLCAIRADVALVVAGDGPYLNEMRQQLAGLPAYFLGYQNDGQLGPLYASADLMVFPSRTDTLGQVVLEAQASGLPVLVSDEGGPKEMVWEEETGLILPAGDPAGWCSAIDELLSDEPRRQRMSQNGPQRISRFSLEKVFDSFWLEHVRAIELPPRDEANIPAAPLSPVPA